MTLGLIMVEMSAHLTEFGKGYAADHGTTPCCQFTVTMFTDDEGMNGTVIHTQMLTQLCFQSGRIQNGTGTDNPINRETGQLLCHIGQDIHRIGYDEENALTFPLCDLRNNALKDCHILLNQLQTGLARFLRRTGRNDDDGGIYDIIVRTCINLHRLCEGNAMADIHRLALCTVMIHIDQNHFRKDTTLHQRKCGGRSYKSAANDGHLADVDIFLN